MQTKLYVFMSVIDDVQILARFFFSSLSYYSMKKNDVTSRYCRRSLYSIDICCMQTFLLHQRGHAFIYCGQVYYVYIYCWFICLGRRRKYEYCFGRRVFSRNICSGNIDSCYLIYSMWKWLEIVFKINDNASYYVDLWRPWWW